MLGNSGALVSASILQAHRNQDSFTLISQKGLNYSCVNNKLIIVRESVKPLF